MFESNLIDLDELVLMVRDRNTRGYVGEAIAAYRVRAYRSALLATWIAVAFDIISKIRELDLQGDHAAGAYVATLDNAIAGSNRGDSASRQRLQSIENELLDKALRDFEFISSQEYSDLSRLKNDRNLCAHPAFMTDASLFQPSAELVRSHITHAVCHVLRHPPVQGKHALKRLKDDLLQASFPASQKAVSEFLDSRYLNYAKVALVESLVTVFLKILIKQSEPDLIQKESAVSMCLVAVGLRHEVLYLQKMAEQLPHLTDGLTDIQLKRLFQLFRADKRCWGWLSEANRVRMTEIIRNYVYDATDIDYVLGGLDIEELKPLLLARITTFERDQAEQLFERLHHPELVTPAIQHFIGARSFRNAEANERNIILPLCSMFKAEHVREILLGAERNGQIHCAGGTPAFIAELFEGSTDLHKTCKEAWQRFMTKMLEGKQPDDFYAFPALRAKMEATGMWPLAE